MHNGVPTHRTNVVIEYLNAKFRGRWIGYNSPYQLWPARSPDLTFIDFLVGDYLKSLVYRIEIMIRNQLVDEIQAACDAEMVSRMTNAVVRRTELCYDNYSDHFESYL